MEKRKLGNQGLEVSAIGLGCMGMNYSYGPSHTSNNLQTLERALELGIHFWDTAEAYGPYLNEELIGQVLKHHRHQVIIATKFAWKNGKSSPENLDASPQAVFKSVEGSLQRLQTDVIDLLYLHRLDPQTPIEETMGAMAKLVRDGKVRFLGLSEVGSQILRRAHAIFPLTALQSEFSLWELNLKETILPTLRELNIGLVAFSPVGRGFLTGTIQKPEDFTPGDMRRTLPRFQGENFKKNIHLVHAIQKIALSKKMTPAQIALAWVLHQGSDIVPIPGTTQVHHLEENAQSVKFQLTQTDLAEIQAILDSIPIAGNRYNETMQKMVNRD